MLRARAEAVQCLGEHLFARAALAEQQRGDVHPGNLLDLAAQRLHGRADGDHAFQRRARLLLHEAAVLRLELMQPEGAIDEQLQRVYVDGLLVEIVGAEADRLERVVAVLVAGDDDHLGGRPGLQDVLQGGEALGDAFGIRRQPEVLQHDRRIVAAQLADRALAVFRDDHVVAVEAPLELLLQPAVVLDDEQLAGRVSHWPCSPCAGRPSRCRGPLRSWVPSSLRLSLFRHRHSRRRPPGTAARSACPSPARW
jgi:hypothetical protein